MLLEWLRAAYLYPRKCSIAKIWTLLTIIPIMLISGLLVVLYWHTTMIAIDRVDVEVQSETFKESFKSQRRYTNELERELMAPWHSRHARLQRRQSSLHRTRKSKFLQKCPSKFESLLLRDKALSTNIFVPSKSINYSSLKQHFWNDLVAQQHSEYGHPDTLQTVQYDTNKKMKSRIKQKKKERDGLRASNCTFHGRVFGVGLFKTGTTSLNAALSFLGYIDNHKTTLYQWLKPYFCIYSHWFLILRHYYDLMHSLCSIDDHQILFDVLTKSRRSFNFGDFPHFLFWPFYDKWYPNSRYILTKRGSTSKYVHSVMTFCIQLQECMNWKFYDDDHGDHGIKRFIDWWHKTGKVDDAEDIKWNELRLKDFRWNQHDEISALEMAHYIAMHYELYNEQVVKYFKERDQMDQLLVLNVDELSDEDLWRETMTFLQCGNEEIFHLQYPHFNPTKRTFTEIQLFPEQQVFDWKQFFENRIPIMMAEHVPHRKFWIEYQHGDWHVLV